MTNRGMVNVNLSIPFTNNGTILRTPIIDNVIKIITSNCVHNNILILITLIIKILNIKCSSKFQKFIKIRLLIDSDVYQ